jgi:hypothetical protein
VPHRDAVGDSDGGELHRVTAGRPHALLRPLRQPVERQVARGHLVPGRGHGDLRLGEVLVGHPDGTQHRPGRRPLHAVGDLGTAGLRVRCPLRCRLAHGCEGYPR